jgi:hypothetical protein
MTNRRSLGCAFFVLAFSGLQAVAEAQTPLRPYTLTVRSDAVPMTMTLKADNARLSDVAADLGTRLRAKVVLGPGVKNDRITVDVPETVIEQALRMLAPRVFIDYEIHHEATPVVLGIFLLGADDPRPASDAVVGGMAQGVLIEGNTEDQPKPPQEDPLRITAGKGILSVTSRKQPLSLVLRAISDVLGVPLELKYDATEIIDTTLSNGLVEETVTALSPNLRVFVRVDVNLAERTPLKIVLERPAAK